MEAGLGPGSCDRQAMRVPPSSPVSRPSASDLGVSTGHVGNQGADLHIFTASLWPGPQHHLHLQKRSFKLRKAGYLLYAQIANQPQS